MKIELQGEQLELLPERAFYWPKESLLGFSDVHLGKAESLQKMGIPIPSGANQKDLSKMASLVEQWKPERVCILGDWIHQRDSWNEELMEDLDQFFRAYSQCEWQLILGNHERGSRPYLEELPLQLHEEHFDLGPFSFTHGHHEDRQNLYRIEGHVHPVVTLSEGPIRMRFPCFVVRRNLMTIPSFGTLTGGQEIRWHRGDRIFAVTPRDVFEIRN